MMRKGMSLLEVVIALTLFGGGLVAFSFVYTKQLESMRLSERKLEGVNVLRAVRTIMATDVLQALSLDCANANTVVGTNLDGKEIYSTWVLSTSASELSNLCPTNPNLTANGLELCLSITHKFYPSIKYSVKSIFAFLDANTNANLTCAQIAGADAPYAESIFHFRPGTNFNVFPKTVKTFIPIDNS